MNCKYFSTLVNVGFLFFLLITPPRTFTLSPYTTLFRSGPGSAARSPSPASPRSCSPPATTPASPAFGPTAPGTLSPPGSARAGPTPPRSRPCSDTPQSTLQPGTSEPGQPRTPKSSNESSATNRPLTSPLPLSAVLGLSPRYTGPAPDSQSSSPTSSTSPNPATSSTPSCSSQRSILRWSTPASSSSS